MSPVVVDGVTFLSLLSLRPHVGDAGLLDGQLACMVVYPPPGF